MSGSLSIGSALPPSLRAYMERAATTGGAPIPVVQLNANVPTLGPYVMGKGQFTTTVYPGPFMHFSTHARLGAHVNTTA